MTLSKVDIEVQMAKLNKDVEYIRKSVDDIAEGIKNDRALFVTKSEYETKIKDLQEEVQKQGDNQSKVVWIVITSFLIAVVNLIIKTK